MGGPIGSCWAAGSWAECWAAGSWADGKAVITLGRIVCVPGRDASTTTITCADRSTTTIAVNLDCPCPS